MLCLLVLAAAGTTGRAQAIITINFDDIASFSQPAEQYAGLGVHFGSGPVGVQVGLANGDSGNWSVNGTNGPYYLGFNGPYAETITFDVATTGVSLDVSRANGSSPTDTFTLTAYAGATAVGSQTVTLATINVWQTVSVIAPGITSIQINDVGSGFSPYGIDNLKIGVTAVPEPSTWALCGLGILALAWRQRQRFAA
jgi:hypothetical protein